MRAIIDLSTDRLQAITQLCEIYHISRAELIRRSIDQFVKTHRTHQDNAFGIFKNNPIDALDYQNKLRDEW